MIQELSKAAKARTSRPALANKHSYPLKFERYVIIIIINIRVIWSMFIVGVCLWSSKYSLLKIIQEQSVVPNRASHLRFKKKNGASHITAIWFWRGQSRLQMAGRPASPRVGRQIADAVMYNRSSYRLCRSSLLAFALQQQIAGAGTHPTESPQGAAGGSGPHTPCTALRCVRTHLCFFAPVRAFSATARAEADQVLWCSIGARTPCSRARIRARHTIVCCTVRHTTHA